MVGGLTPRMRYALVAAADAGKLRLRQDAEGFVVGRPGGKYWGSQFVPSPLRDRVFKVFVRGMLGVTEIFGALLRKRVVPTPSVLMSALSPFGGRQAKDLGVRLDRHAVSHFFAKGGEVMYVIQAVLQDAICFYEEHELQGETRKAADELEDSLISRYHNLPLHMLDGDFDFARAILMGEPCEMPGSTVSCAGGPS